VPSVPIKDWLTKVNQMKQKQRPKKAKLASQFCLKNKHLLQKGWPSSHPFLVITR
jgi:hypothetical protein